MALEPLTIELSEGQKTEVLKRFHRSYHAELEKVEGELRQLLTGNAEAEFLAQYIKEQPEVTQLRADPAAIKRLEQRREYLAQLIKVLEHYTPEQKEIKPLAPAERVRRF
jgi:hypothetical protein